MDRFHCMHLVQLAFIAVKFGCQCKESTDMLRAQLCLLSIAFWAKLLLHLNGR